VGGQRGAQAEPYGGSPSKAAGKGRQQQAVRISQRLTSMAADLRGRLDVGRGDGDDASEGY
jgi:hypothetical protein